MIIPHPKAYFFIYRLQTCILVGFAPPMVNAQILIEDSNICGRYKIGSFKSSSPPIFFVATSSSMMGVAMEYWNISQVVYTTTLLHTGGGL